MEVFLNRRGVGLALIIFVGCVAFHNTFENSFHYDDDHSILQNPHIRSLQNIPAFFVDPALFSGLPEASMYRPLVLVSYAFNYAWGQYEVTGYHFFNLLLHLVNTWLIWNLGGRLLRNPQGALFAALFFALHPIMSEPVNYISSRSSLLATVFYLWGFLVLLRAVETPFNRGKAGQIALLYLAGLGSKSIAFSWPLIALVYMHLLAARRIWRLLLAPLLLSAAYLLFTRAIVGKALLEPVRSHFVQWATQIKALSFYLWTVIQPVQLSVEPQFQLARSLLDWPVVLAGAMVLSLVLLALWGRAHKPVVAFGMAWFFLTLLPSSLVPLFVLVNEHRLYLPMAGAALAFGALLPQRRPWTWALGAGLLAIFLLHCIQRNEVWKSEETLWADAVARGPAMARPHANLGKAYLEQGRYREAVEASRRAIQIDPLLERAYYNIGTAYLGQGKHELAIAHYQRALEIQPALFEAQNNLGNAFQEAGRLDEAVQAYKKALEFLPQAQVFHNLGGALLRLGRSDAAEVAFRRALDLQPGMRESYKGLIKACHAGEKLQTVLEVTQKALEHWPQDATFWLLAGDAHMALGQDYQAAQAYRKGGQNGAAIQMRLGDEARRRGDWERARKHYQGALKEGGEDAQIYNALGEICRAQEQTAEALQFFRQAIRLDPQMALAFANIGRTYLKYGGPLEAIAAMRRAVELKEEEGVFRALLADAYSKANRWEEACEAYREAIRLAPERVEFYQNLGLLYQREGLEVEAENMYRAALERNPHLPGVLYNLGNLYLDRGNLQEALKAYRNTLEIAPEHVDLHFNLGKTLLRLGREAEAVVAFERFLELYGVDDELSGKVRHQLEGLKQDSGRSRY